MFEDQLLQPAEVEQAVVQGLLDGGDERRSGGSPLQLDQPAQGAPVARMTALLESGGVAVEAWVMAGQ